MMVIGFRKKKYILCLLQAILRSVFIVRNIRSALSKKQKKNLFGFLKLKFSHFGDSSVNLFYSFHCAAICLANRINLDIII